MKTLTEINGRFAVTRVGVQEDTKDGLGDEFLRDHGVKDGGNIISSNGGVSQTENAVHRLTLQQIIRFVRIITNQ
jgi:hypothetical protein